MTNVFPCAGATPLLSASSGFEQCDGGYVRRTGVGTCPSDLPRGAPVQNYNAAIDECERDADCDASSLGPYAHCGVRDGGFARRCTRGCVTDADCASGQLCFCGEPVGRCVSTSCLTSDDCDPGFDCASFSAQPGCFSTEFACQVPGDACAGDGDCTGISPNASFCILAGGARACTITQCTTP